jgi:2-dehydro-3-deoxyphosphogluconate aldolase/(4S)-4-hydroxy-2-oxoglutarate aldolase
VDLKDLAMTDMIASLEAKRVVPLVQSDDPATALKISEALLEGGLDVLEVVLRTDAALDCLEAIAKEFPKAHVGAGTVLSADQSEEVIRRGATFIVSPGLDPASVKVAKDAGVPILPGVSTATELQQAWNLGLRTVKLFPASLVGGPKMAKALSSVFRDVRFMPTGGVSPANLKDYLAVPAVLACGGSWLTPKDAIIRGDFAAITSLAKEAVAIAQS